MTSSTNNNTATTSSQIVLTLAHLLQQHSLSYDSEKNSLLHTSVRCASHLANNTTGGGEVHIVLTGSPRPTFAETNAWLLEGSSSAAAAAAGNSGVSNGSATSNNDIAMTETDDTNDRPAHLKGSYSIADNVHHSSSNIYNNQEEEERMMQEDENTTKSELQDYITEFTDSKDGGNGVSTAAVTNSKRGITGGGGHNTSFIRRNTTGVTTTTNNTNNNADDSTNTTNRRRSTIDAAESSSSSSVTNNTGPMVGQAVVNAISQSSGVGLQSSRSKLLQGTIDRPLWSQNRWTDGECLFSELVELCGMERFEMVGGAAHKKKLQQQQQQKQGGPDDAAGGAGAPSLAVVASPPPATAATNMSANLITVPATTLREPNAGVSQTTMDEIARGVLRTVKRKKSPPASKVYIVVPGVNQGVSEEQRGVVVTSLKQAWEKLEQYNHMIGQPNLISGAELEFVDV
eukprot:CAMPEP_0113389820 /NCGR_PEP_ID=MMETSP0013_2-20120614/9829_1 /TAXON_ID=2843 ORGANISM="Skeletonema costatum, Strain 1716" /NCGR_SAMPLE_ID=MMETSP0013_2 /ASSEMBLY_ACC=CAM_ASM_000158 /LENGTH=457 /DNA_ID=CAMNT_0000272919 /DNA_START=75 /DNA_END=1448 /DNA_ORIENTATION=- /assembly_acc=CAM_ASM_000158